MGALWEGELREHGHSAVVELYPAQHQSLPARAVSIQERGDDLGHHDLVSEQHPLQYEAVEVGHIKELCEHEQSVLRLAGHDLVLRESVYGDSERLQCGDLVVRRVHHHVVDAGEEEVEGGRVCKLYPEFFQGPEGCGEDSLDEVVAVGDLILVALCLHHQTHVADVLEDGRHLLDATVLPELGAEEVPGLQLHRPRSVVARLEQHHRHALVG